MKLEVLYVRDCPNLAPMLERLAEVTDEPVSTRLVESEAEAVRLGMAGSPTLLVDGVDPFADEGSCDCGVSCRLYRDEAGRITDAPSADQLREVLSTAADSCCADCAGGGLSDWRARAVPVDRVEQAVHRAILAAFAETGRPPLDGILDALTAGGGRSTSEVLTKLHDADTIRLDASGGIAVAYPFSAVPTAHRVRIGGEVEVYAMCAVDALGISAMLGRDTVIESVDATTGRPVTVAMGGADAAWSPADAVVFVSTAAGRGPSAENCCGSVNFFTGRASAEEWMAANPGIPGEIVGRADAERLGVGIFAHLLGGTPH